MSQQAVLKLEESVNISFSEKMYEQLESLLKAGGDIQIDAQAVERIDTSAFQLLYSFQQTLQNQHAKALIINPSDAFMVNARLLGMDSVLNIQR